MVRYIFFLLCIPYSIFASGIADFNQMSKNKDVTFFLSTPKSGTNLITGCLSAITRKPISWFYWGTSILNPASQHRNHISYNRLALPLISDIPLLYRTHYQYAELLEISSQENKLIFATRNPKELLYRKFFQTSSLQDPDPKFIEEFLNNYLLPFEVYNSWFPDTRILIFYEDFINNEEDLLLELLHFMKESPVYLQDFLNNKEEYFYRLLESYTNQHVHNSGGASSRGSPKPIFYTRNASVETLKYIDEYLQKSSPHNWEKYLKRFQVFVKPQDTF